MENLHLPYNDVVFRIPYRNLIIMQKDKLHTVFGEVLQEVSDAEMFKNRKFDEWLKRKGYLCQKGDYYNQPTQKAMKLGLFELKKTSITKPDGSVLVTTTTKVTGKSQIYFVDKFLGKDVAW